MTVFLFSCKQDCEPCGSVSLGSISIETIYPDDFVNNYEFSTGNSSTSTSGDNPVVDDSTINPCNPIQITHLNSTLLPEETDAGLL